MKEWQTRLVAEKAELTTKVMKLMVFVKTDKYWLLDEESQRLLADQLVTMMRYEDILEKRIDLF